MGCLYKITDPNGKSYIGITKSTLKNRWRQHVYASRTSDRGIDGAISKFLPERMSIEILIVADDPEYLASMERACIKSFNTLDPNGYNLGTGGQRNFSVSDSTREKMSASLKIRMSRKGEKERVSEKSKKWWSENPKALDRFKSFVADVWDGKRCLVIAAKQRMNRKRKSVINGCAIMYTVKDGVRSYYGKTETSRIAVAHLSFNHNAEIDVFTDYEVLRFSSPLGEADKAILCSVLRNPKKK